jgi:drug/metabolite transporter (DMT)-like permease
MTPGPTRFSLPEVDGIVKLAYPKWNSAKGLMNRCLVPLSVHQLVRATIPAITALILVLLRQKTYTSAATASLGLVCFGVALATTRRDLNQPLILRSDDLAKVDSIILTLLGASFASMKSIVTTALQGQFQISGIKTGLGLSPAELICLISPLVLAQSVLFAWMAGELDQLLLSMTPATFSASAANEGYNQGIDGSLALLLILDCMTACALNLASFEANRRVGALGITVAGSLKQVLIVGLECVTGGESWTSTRYVGVLATMTGSCWFAFEEKRSRGARSGYRAEREGEAPN